MMMKSKYEAERADQIRAMQREKERERRRLRDRERRQNMSQEQRERHLARRRKNYQLRRLRAQHAHLLGSHQSHPNLPSLVVDPQLVKPHHYSLFIPQTQFTASSTTQALGAQQLSPNFQTRLRLSDIRHLARRLHNNGMHQDGEDATTKDYFATNCLSTKRLRLVHVKRLARSIKVNVK